MNEKSRRRRKKRIPCGKSGLPVGFFCGYVDKEDVLEYFGEDEKNEEKK